MQLSRRGFLSLVPAVPFIKVPEIVEESDYQLPLTFTEEESEKLIGNVYFDFESHKIYLDGPQSFDNIYRQTNTFWMKSGFITYEGRDVITYPFPFEAITPEFFKLKNTWDIKFGSRKKIRTAGWRFDDDPNNETNDKRLGIITLGRMDKSTKVYYRFGKDWRPRFFSKTGRINEAIRIENNADNLILGYVSRQTEKLIDVCDLSTLGFSSIKDTNSHGVLRFLMFEEDQRFI